MQQTTDFDDLEALVAESTRTVTAATVGDLDDLDQLLSESIAIKQDEAAGRAYRELLKRGGMSKDEKLEVERKLQEWESRREWETQANIALFRHTTCRCGCMETAFVGMYYKQKHRTLRDSSRIVAARTAADGEAGLEGTVPNLTQYEVRTTIMCAHCAGEQGFDMIEATKAEWTHHE